MKTVKTILLSLALIALVSISGKAQNEAKVIAVINKADWCPTCQQNGKRAMSAFMENNKDMSVQFIANDLSNDDTKKNSTEELKKVGLDQVIGNYKGTGVAYFFNSESKALISQISVSKSDNELADALTSAKKVLKPACNH